jgi:hypothetical protein
MRTDAALLQERRCYRRDAATGETREPTHVPATCARTHITLGARQSRAALVACDRSLRFAPLSSPAPQCRMPHAASMHSLARGCMWILGSRACARILSRVVLSILSRSLASCSHTLACCSLCVLLSTLASCSLCVHAYSRVFSRRARILSRFASKPYGLTDE